MEGHPLHPWRTRLDVEERVFLIGLQEHSSTPTFYAIAGATQLGTNELSYVTEGAFNVGYQIAVPCS